MLLSRETREYEQDLIEKFKFIFEQGQMNYKDNVITAINENYRYAKAMHDQALYFGQQKLKELKEKEQQEKATPQETNLNDFLNKGNRN